MSEINKAFKDFEASTSPDNTAVYRINDNHSVIVSDGTFTITNTNGDILDQIPIATFSKSPRTGFRKIKKALNPQ